MSNHPWLKFENGYCPVNGHASYLIRKWSQAFLQFYDEIKTIQDLESAKRVADFRTLLRSYPIELLISPLSELTQEDIIKASILIAEIGLTYSMNEESTREKIATLRGYWNGLEHHLTWIVPNAADEEFHVYNWGAKYPGVTIKLKEAIKPHSVTKSDLCGLLEKCRSKAQREVLPKMASMAEAVEYYNGEVSGFKLRRAFFLIGPSGSGKTWLATHALPALLGLRAYETTVASWSPRNSKSNKWTISTILELLDSGPLVISIDECDKIRNQESGNSANWYRSCQDEIMGLLTGSLNDFNPTEIQLANLNKSWIVCSGAFQDLYDLKLGNSRDLKSLERLSIGYEDVESADLLPTELLNRMGPMIEVAPPSLAEIRGAMHLIEIEIGVCKPADEREAAARKIVMSRKGFRGIEEYLLECAQSAMKLDKRKVDPDTFEGLSSS